MYADTDLHLCVLTPSQRYKSTHCLSQHILLQIAIAQVHQSFLYFTVIFHPKGKQSVLSATLYVENDQFKFRRSTAAQSIEISTIFYDTTRKTCHFQHNGWRTTTTFCEL